MKYRVWSEEDGESEARTYEKGAAWAAAEAWADDGAMDCDAPAVTVYVKAPNGTVTRWAVTGQMIPEYMAEPLNDGGGAA